MKAFRRLREVLSECEWDLGRDGLESDSQRTLIRRLASEGLSGKGGSAAWGRKFAVLVLQRSSSGQKEVLMLPEPPSVTNFLKLRQSHSDPLVH